MSEINTTQQGLRVSGDVVFSNAADILTQACEVLKKHPAETIVINLAEVNRIDSAGIALLLVWKRLCDELNKSFRIEAAQPQILSLIESNKLATILD